MRYFAYGSNLNSDDLGRWCRERALPEIELGAGRGAFLPDRRLAFTHRSRTRGGGVLDIVPSVGSAVAGIEFNLTHDAVAVLDRKEAEGHVYRRIEATALRVDGTEHRAFTYEVEPPEREPFIVPPPSYLDVIRRGYEGFGLDRAPLEAAARELSHPGPVSRLFVYGSLMRGEERHPALQRHRPRLVASGRVPGTLHDLGAYPGLSPESSGVAVAGELYEAPELAALLMDTDRIEGFPGFGVPGVQYRRAIVQVTSGAGHLWLAWTYVFAGETADSPVVASGDWRRR
jgi:gamma-glutamylcyclotransferase (GGCT)/AIG2-like uncharacterized protein YtfP